MECFTLPLDRTQAGTLKRGASRLASTRSIVNRNVSLARAMVGRVVELQTHEGSATFSNVNRAARLHRLLVILSMATARPGIRAVDLAETLKVSTRTVFRDLAELQRLGFPVTFGNGYPAQQELFRRRRRQEMSQVLADLVEQQLEVVRRKLPTDEAEQLVNERPRDRLGGHAGARKSLAPVDLQLPHGRLAQLVRALGSHPRGRGFESPADHFPTPTSTVRARLRLSGR